MNDMYFLTGGSGILGHELQKYLNCCAPSSRQFNIKNEIPQEDLLLEQIAVLKDCKSFIHSAAFTNVPQCEIDRKKAIDTNIMGTKNIVQVSRIFGKRLVYISTDYVYAGTDGNYLETDLGQPFNFYGWTKYAGESFLDLSKDLIIRTSFKPNTKWAYPEAFVDLYTSADYVDVIAKKISNVIKSELTGIINIGTEKKSIFDLAKQRTSDILPISVKNVKNVRMPRDISMNLKKLQEFEAKRV